MNKYFCHSCGISLGYFPKAYTSSLAGSTYQLEKLIKHFFPDPKYSYHSVFDSPSTDVYRNYVVSASCSGAIEFDDKGRKNIIWVAGKNICASYVNGILHLPEEALKVVHSTDPHKIHAYPESSTKFTTQICENCSGPAVA
jgi:hypothetical protein